jgi:hypothetical protein
MVRKMSSKYIRNISLNPFFCSKLIPHFISGYQDEVEFPLIYLILPYVLYEPSRTVLKTAKANSSIYSLFIDNEKLTNIAGIEKRYEMFKELTNQSLIVACNEGLVEFKGKIRIIKKVNYQDEKDANLREYYRAAHYLGKIFSKYTTFDIFCKIGVKVI